MNDNSSSLIQTLEHVAKMEDELSGKPLRRCGVTSNVSIDLLSLYLRKYALLNGLSVEVDAGNYDDTLNNAKKFAADNVDIFVYMPFFDNLMPSFESQITLLDDSLIDQKLRNFKDELDLVLKLTVDIPHVFVATFQRIGFSTHSDGIDEVKETISRFNKVMSDSAKEYPNVTLVDSESIILKLGENSSYDYRFYQMSMSPYTPAFFDQFAYRISNATRGFGSYYYKALVLDCDNTLWGGILGEEGLSGIKLDQNTYPGRVYWKAQLTFKALESRGILLCLCSKNNTNDVDKVLDTHPYSVIRNRDIAVKKINWVDKVSNLREIASELNISLDSLVFVDDSEFECAAVKAQLPEVKVLRVPEQLSQYDALLEYLAQLFLSGGISNESTSKTSQYKQIRNALIDSHQFQSHEEYLGSLDLEVEFQVNNISATDRIAELTQKSNQFNLTTLRLTPSQVRARMCDPMFSVYSLTVNDKFGSAGLTGVMIILWSGKTAIIEEFLLSCRVLGRGIEFSLWPTLLQDALHHGCETLEATYMATQKNNQVKDFYEKIGLRPIFSDENSVRYHAKIQELFPPATEWIKVTHHGE